MRIIISPAKKMKEEDLGLAYEGLPEFLSETEKILEKLQSMSCAELKKLWVCNDKIIEQNVNRLKNMDL